MHYDVPMALVKGIQREALKWVMMTMTTSVIILMMSVFARLLIHSLACLFTRSFGLRLRLEPSDQSSSSSSKKRKKKIYGQFDKTQIEDFHKRDFRLDNKSGSSSLRLLLLFVLCLFHYALSSSFFFSCSNIYLIWCIFTSNERGNRSFYKRERVTARATHGKK